METYKRVTYKVINKIKWGALATLQDYKEAQLELKLYLDKANKIIEEAEKLSKT